MGVVAVDDERQAHVAALLRPPPSTLDGWVLRVNHCCCDAQYTAISMLLQVSL